jgi:hypothetical protein
MKTKHTPGPWDDTGHDGKDTQIVSSQWGEVARVVYNGDCAQRTANARLIAAAPELLEALAFYADSANWFGAPAPVYLDSGKLARAAIAKAEGQE